MGKLLKFPNRIKPSPSPLLTPEELQEIILEVQAELEIETKTSLDSPQPGEDNENT